MELGLGPLVGRAMSRGMSRGGYGLRKSLGSLSADEWGCVPSLLIVWPEVFQSWSLQAVRWDLVLILITQERCLSPARVEVEEHSPILHHQLL